MGLTNTSNSKQQTFNKELSKDVSDLYRPTTSWSHCRNGISNSKSGDLGKLGNEPSNKFCQEASYPIIGVIHITGSLHLIFSTDNDEQLPNPKHEIGIFDEEHCEYTKLITGSSPDYNTSCLNFSQYHPIIGVCRPTSNCTFKAYWDDGRHNPSRVMEFSIDPISANLPSNENSPLPWEDVCNIVDSCKICHRAYPYQFKCNEMRLSRFIKVPCIQAKKGVTGGTLLNGSYLVAVAYSIDGQKISDWYLSNVQSLWEHNNSCCSLDVTFGELDQNFDEIQIAIVSIVNQQTTVKLAGTYSTNQHYVSFDVISPEWVPIPIEQIPIMTPAIEASDAMFSVNNYLLRTGPTSRFDFNYQPLANQIVAKWVSMEFPADYYVKGGNKTNYMRDEVYPFFIRWIYSTGDKSSSYHIPGRPITHNNPIWGDEFAYISTDALTVEIQDQTNRVWVVENTAFATAPVNYAVPSDPYLGVVVGEGYMAYWESDQFYPDDKPEIWDSFSNPNPYFNYGSNQPYANLQVLPENFDLCGKQIRHHKFPENATDTSVDYYNKATNKIRILGVEFENIKFPIDNEGNPIEDIVGYEILRGSRNGNKTVIAKGILNHMREYRDLSGDTTRYPMLFPNYPYDDMNDDMLLSKSKTTWGNGGNIQSGLPLDEFSNSIYTFHSPETNFTNPYLSANELKIYGAYNGGVTGKFEKSEQHPKNKLLTNFSLVISAVAGIGLAALAINGTKTTRYVPPYFNGVSGIGAVTAFTFPDPAMDVAVAGMNVANIFNDDLYNGLVNGGAVLGYNLGGGIDHGTTDPSWLVYDALQKTASLIPGMSTNYQEVSLTDTSGNRGIPAWARIPFGPRIFLNHFVQGADATLRLLEAVAPFRDHTLRYHSHCFYDNFEQPISGIRRRTITKQEYIGPQITQFGPSKKINNLYRVKTVALEVENLSGVESIPSPIQHDFTRFSVTNPNIPFTDFVDDPTTFSFDNTVVSGGMQIASSHYVALKQRMRGQYGQINGVKQVPASYCPLPAPPIRPGSTTSSGPIFGGDTYVNRYTEKNTFYFFYDWLYGQPDGSQFDYEKYRMLAWPTYWANFDKYDLGEFVTTLGASIVNLITGNSWTGITMPSDMSFLDGDHWFQYGAVFKLTIKNGWFYLFYSGIRDFYCESEINLAQRDYGETIEEQFYNSYGGTTDTREIFNTKVIKAGNYCKYDQSLSISKLFINYVNWATVQQGDYNPTISETCYEYYPKRIVYSLPMQEEGKRDNWYFFLPNNYKDFLTRVTCVKPVNKSGALIFFQNESPRQFMGVDQLQTTGGTKLTIGDGGLFSQPMQNLINVDTPYEFGSCQDRLSVINTPAGLFWISENQGKIFVFNGGGMDELSKEDLKWWFALYLPYKLTEQFPNFQLTDNPIKGIGCQSIYDSENSLVYFCKRDFIVRPDIKEPITYSGYNDLFYVNGKTPIYLGNPNYFEDASWTISYDPKVKSFISWHDWHPNLCIPGKNTFMSVKDNKIWQHNWLCDSYCNYYGEQFPFELEYTVNTANQVNVLRSIEYELECYKYAENCYDRFHVLDYNFDEAVIYNTEQCSGLLKLHDKPKNNPWATLQYPKYNPLGPVDVLYDKVEQKYRINQFVDLTDDRGEYNINAQRLIWETAANGYVRTLNPNNLNYSKLPAERKKLRHYTNSVFLRRTANVKEPIDLKMMMLITNNKNLISPR